MAIVGAGPAGSLAACLLARGGYPVLLIEQHRFPREKVCGECLSALGIRILRQAGVDEIVRSAGAVELRRVALYPCRGTPLVADLPEPMWGLSRGVLDEILLEAAREAGASVLQPARCEDVDGRLRVRRFDTNQLQTFDVDWIILADGRGALLADRPAPTGDLGLKAHFTGVEGARDRVELFALDGHYVGAAPIEGGRWNVAMSVPAARVAEHRGNLDGAWASMLPNNRAMSARFSRAQRLGPWMAAPLPRFGVARNWPAGVIPIGNAAGAVEPIGGEGMGLALASAAMAAEELLEALRGGRAVRVDALRRRFKALWNQRRLGCRAVAMGMARPALAGRLIGLARRSPALARGVMRWMGKG